MWAPDIEVFQKDNELTIRADLPGLKKEEVTVAGSIAPLPIDTTTARDFR
jgi:HSP20 family molecular chaperone IbpA